MNAIVVSAAVLIEDGKVLLTQRPRGTHLEDLWEFPGGKVEDSESPQDALVRELREELGIDVVVHEPVEITYWRYPKRDVLLLFFRVERTATSAPVQNVQVAAHVWCDEASMDRYPMPPADVPVVTRVRALLKR